MYDVLEGNLFALSINWISLPRKLRLDSLLPSSRKIFHGFFMLLNLLNFFLSLFYSFYIIWFNCEAVKKIFPSKLMHRYVFWNHKTSSMFHQISFYSSIISCELQKFPASSFFSSSGYENWLIWVILWLSMRKRTVGCGTIKPNDSKYHFIINMNVSMLIKFVYPSSPTANKLLYMIISFYCDETGH